MTREQLERAREWHVLICRDRGNRKKVVRGKYRKCRICSGFHPELYINCPSLTERRRKS